MQRFLNVDDVRKVLLHTYKATKSCNFKVSKYFFLLFKDDHAKSIAVPICLGWPPNNQRVVLDKTSTVTVAGWGSSSRPPDLGDLKYGVRTKYDGTFLFFILFDLCISRTFIKAVFQSEKRYSHLSYQSPD